MSTQEALKERLQGTSLPTGWRTVRLAEICELRTGGTPSKADPRYFGGDIRWLVSGDIHRREITDCEGRITPLGMANSNASLLPPDSVMIALNGQGKTRGTVALLCVEATCNQSLVAMIPKDKEVLLSRFLLYQLQMRYQELRNLTGDNQRSGLNMGILERFEVRLAPIEEQRKIVATLRDQIAAVEKARAAYQARLEAANLLPAAYMSRYLEDSEARRWQYVRLGSVCTIDAKQVDPTMPEYRDLPHVNGENIETGTGRLFGIKSAAEDGMISGKYLFDAGVVLYSKLRPYLRKVALADFRGLCSADMYPLSFDLSRVDRRFALWVLLAKPFTDYAIRESQRARMPKLNRDQLFAWQFPLPAMEQQRSVAAALERCIAGSQALTKALLDEQKAIDDLHTAMFRIALTEGV